MSDGTLITCLRHPFPYHQPHWPLQTLRGRQNEEQNVTEHQHDGYQDSELLLVMQWS